MPASNRGAGRPSFIVRVRSKRSYATTTTGPRPYESRVWETGGIFDSSPRCVFVRRRFDRGAGGGGGKGVGVSCSMIDDRIGTTPQAAAAAAMARVTTPDASTPPDDLFVRRLLTGGVLADARGRIRSPSRRTRVRLLDASEGEAACSNRMEAPRRPNKGRRHIDPLFPVRPSALSDELRERYHPIEGLMTGAMQYDEMGTPLH